MDLDRLKTSHRINLLISGIIIFLISGIIVLFVRHRILLKNIAPAPSPQKTEANITIQNFQHVATEDGIIQWTLEAGSASMYSMKNTAELNNLSVVFFMKKDRKLTMKADHGLLNSKTDDMSLSGNIRAEIDDYLLTTESLNYRHHSRIIEVTTPVDIIGPLVTLTADTLNYDINTAKMRCDGNVNGSFIETHDSPPK
ncbi:MAG: LPS export ABC transporter periplasmic protein LptC [Desulfobacterales bacterium CG23_combo_of_CG06-09_8_20_14_all_51_8]|nr:MAG: LPS export ABC transporter periplasmic protein LptC [Desulfobacterales bacterium CG23_combo_of_CG06-09_8_20_14_all_51_8]